LLNSKIKDTPINAAVFVVGTTAAASEIVGG
jgi:hypothetical protein